MNNNKLILEALGFLLDTTTLNFEENKKYLKLRSKIDQALNPKEDVPYEDSFAKSSKGEEKQ